MHFFKKDFGSASLHIVRENKTWNPLYLRWLSVDSNEVVVYCSFQSPFKRLNYSNLQHFSYLRQTFERLSRQKLTPWSSSFLTLVGIRKCLARTNFLYNIFGLCAFMIFDCVFCWEIFVERYLWLPISTIWFSILFSLPRIYRILLLVVPAYLQFFGCYWVDIPYRRKAVIFLQKKFWAVVYKLLEIKIVLS